MSPAELSRRAQTTDATISNWMNDKVTEEHAKAALLFRISRVLRIRPEWLLFGEEPRQATARAADTVISASQPVKLPLLTSALQLVGSILQESELPMAPEKQAELVSLVYELLEEGMPEAKVLRFARAAA